MIRRSFLYMWCAGALLLLASMTTPARAQIAIEGGLVHTLDGDDAGALIDGGVVLIGADGRIQAVGGAGLAIPPGFTVIDARGKVVTPGLIDAQTQLGVAEIWAVEQSVDGNAGGEDPIRAAFEVVDGVNPRSEVIPIQRPGGVTDVLVVPDGGIISGWSAWLTLADTGRFQYARIERERVALHIDVTAGAAALIGGSRGRLFALLRELMEDARVHAAQKARFDENRMRDLRVGRLDLDALSRAQTAGGPVVITAHRASDIEAALRWSEREKLRVIISGGAEAWLVAEQLAARSVPVILDPLSNLPVDFDQLAAREDNAALLDAAGVRVILSTFSTHNVRKLRQLAGNAVRAGLSYEAALASITRAPAEAFGLSDRGVLRVGAAANLVIWSGDPFELSTQAEQVLVDGRAVDLDNRQRQLLERYRTLPRRAPPAPAPER